MRRTATVLHGYEDEASDSEDDSISFISGNSTSAAAANRRRVPIRYGYSIVPLDEEKEKKNRGVGHDHTVKYKKRKKYLDPKDSYDITDDDEEDGDAPNDPVRQTKNKVKRRSHANGTTTKKRRSSGNNSIDYNVVFVVDYDMTLVDRNAHPFPGVKEFLRDLYEFDGGGRSTLVLYSHATSGHVEHGLNTYFADEISYFSEIIADHSMLKNKPVTRVRRVLSNVKCLCGPICIIDDVRTNLDDDQYDITVDASRHFVRDRSSANGRVVGVDYESILCLLRRGVQQWLATKTGGQSILTAATDSGDSE